MHTEGQEEDSQQTYTKISKDGSKNNKKSSESTNKSGNNQEKKLQLVINNQNSEDIQSARMHVDTPTSETRAAHHNRLNATRSAFLTKPSNNLNQIMG